MRQAGVRKDSFLDIDNTLIPICSDNHWTLAVVLPSKLTVTHMDSMLGGRGRASVTSRLLEWVEITLKEKFVKEDWMVVDFAAPLQTNDRGCGVFAITSLCMALGFDLKKAYTEEQLSLQRRRLAAMLINGSFKGDFDPEGI
jgi:Ulp1 family protease